MSAELCRQARAHRCRWALPIPSPTYLVVLPTFHVRVARVFDESSDSSLVVHVDLPLVPSICGGVGGVSEVARHHVATVALLGLVLAHELADELDAEFDALFGFLFDLLGGEQSEAAMGRLAHLQLAERNEVHVVVFERVDQLTQAQVDTTNKVRIGAEVEGMENNR